MCSAGVGSSSVRAKKHFAKLNNRLAKQEKTPGCRAKRCLRTLSAVQKKLEIVSIKMHRKLTKKSKQRRMQKQQLETQAPKTTGDKTKKSKRKMIGTGTEIKYQSAISYRTS